MLVFIRTYCFFGGGSKLLLERSSGFPIRDSLPGPATSGLSYWDLHIRTFLFRPSHKESFRLQRRTSPLLPFARSIPLASLSRGGDSGFKLFGGGLHEKSSVQKNKMYSTRDSLAVPWHEPKVYQFLGWGVCKKNGRIRPWIRVSLCEPLKKRFLMWAP